MKRHSIAIVLAALWAVSGVGCSSAPTQQPVAEAIDDGVVTAKIKAALVDDPVTKVHHINVETFKGRVQLSGYVETDQVRTRALELARNVQGVRQVRDALELRKKG